LDIGPAFKIQGEGKQTPNERAPNATLFAVPVEEQKVFSSGVNDGTKKAGMLYPLAMGTKIETCAAKSKVMTHGLLFGDEAWLRKRDEKRGLPPEQRVRMMYMPSGAIADFLSSEDLKDARQSAEASNPKRKMLGFVRISDESEVNLTLEDVKVLALLREFTLFVTVLVINKKKKEQSKAFRLSDHGVETVQAIEALMAVDETMFEHVTTKAESKGTGARMHLRLQGQDDPWDAFQKTLRSVYEVPAKPASHSNGLPMPDRGHELMGDLIEDKIPDFARRLAEQMKETYVAIAKNKPM
jgi:hypothetical protein